MSNEKPIVRKLKCGGHGVYTIDSKTKQLAQTGYIGPNLSLEAFLPKDAVIEKWRLNALLLIRNVYNINVNGTFR